MKGARAVIEARLEPLDARVQAGDKEVGGGGGGRRSRAIIEARLMRACRPGTRR